MTSLFGSTSFEKIDIKQPVIMCEMTSPRFYFLGSAVDFSSFWRRGNLLYTPALAYLAFKNACLLSNLQG